MVDRHTTLFHHLLKVSVTQRVLNIPTGADGDHINQKEPSL